MKRTFRFHAVSAGFVLAAIAIYPATVALFIATTRLAIWAVGGEPTKRFPGGEVRVHEGLQAAAITGSLIGLFLAAVVLIALVFPALVTAYRRGEKP
ncbi:MAG: hypothetical protein KA310_03590 [Pseudomonadales bacterium]|nr:hypothetical protein [Pseudomonadales bacterium]